MDWFFGLGQSKKKAALAQEKKEESSGMEGESVHDKYQIDQGRRYGEGGYGATFRCVERSTNKECAVKVIDTRKMGLAGIQKECLIMSRLSHPNIIAIYDHARGGRGKEHLYFIYMECASGGELFDQLTTAGGSLGEERSRGYMQQMVKAIAFCHTHGVAHRDIKLENVLLNAEGAIKVIDFGLAHVYHTAADGTPDRSVPLHEQCGSKSYAAPEVMAASRAAGRGYDGYAADVWSLAVSLFAMLAGFFP